MIRNQLLDISNIVAQGIIYHSDGKIMLCPICMLFSKNVLSGISHSGLKWLLVLSERGPKW